MLNYLENIFHATVKIAIEQSIKEINDMLANVLWKSVRPSDINIISVNKVLALKILVKQHWHL